MPQVNGPGTVPATGTAATVEAGKPEPVGAALCVGLSSFRGQTPPDQEPPADAWPDLDYAGPTTKDLSTALADLGFTCTVLTERELPTAEALGARVRASIRACPPPSAQIIHVLSHGGVAASGLYVVGADGRLAPSTKAESWVGEVEDFPDRPHTLFVLDTCYSGQAARLDWLRAATEQTRAWVIAASRPDAPAYGGRLTRAVAAVLARIASGELDFAPSAYVPFGHLVDHVRREVIRSGGDGQYVTGTPMDGLFEPPLVPNPRPALPGSARAALAGMDPLTGPFGDIDAALDPAHFLDRAAGHRDRDLTETVGC